MPDLMQVVPFPERASGETPFLESEHTQAFLLGPSAALPAGASVVLDLPDGSRFVYVARGASEPPATLAIDPTVRGNHFRPLHEGPKVLAALLSLAASRRVDTGPESERVFVFLRGNGLVSLENGDVVRFAPNHVALVPAGEPARLWAQGPEDVLAVAIQPRAPPAERRTLAGEIARQRAQKEQL